MRREIHEEHENTVRRGASNARREIETSDRPRLPVPRSYAMTDVEVQDDRESSSSRTYLCVPRDSPCRFGDTVFHASNERCYVTEFDDYTLITDRDFTPFLRYAPTSLLPLLQPRWRYVLHVSHGNRLCVSPDLLQARVIGGQIVAYAYRRCSIAGNECAYYGFIPTLDVTLRDTHHEPHLTLQPVYPRKLYVYLEQRGICRCSPNCVRWAMLTYRGGLGGASFCVRRIDWTDVYPLMGDMIETDEDAERRCYVCSQCYACQVSASRCRKHRVCLHRHDVLELPGSSATTSSSFTALPGDEDVRAAVGHAFQEKRGRIAVIRSCARVAAV